MLKRPDASDPTSVRYRMRKARFVRIEALIDGILAHRPVARILDLGGRREYWKLLDARFRDKVEITILNLEEEVALENQADEFGIAFRTVVGDATRMSEYGDASFDLTHSNSVIEHVGLYSAMMRFAAETRRVGNAYYLQTPNFWFPLEPHYGIPFFHWLPEPTRLYLHSHVNVGFSKKTDYRSALGYVDHTRIVSRRLLREGFPDAVHHGETFLGLTKSLIVTREYRAAPGTGRPQS